MTRHRLAVVAKSPLWLATAFAAATTASQVGAQGQPRIDEIVWPWIDSYCTFMKSDHTFEFDSLESWRFVFFTAFPEEGEDLMAHGFVRIDGRLRELILVSSEEIRGTELRTYRTFDDPPYLVAVEATPGEQGYESTDYNGTISVSRSGASSTLSIYGDCGV